MSWFVLYGRTYRVASYIDSFNGANESSTLTKDNFTGVSCTELVYHKCIYLLTLRTASELAARYGNVTFCL